MTERKFFLIGKDGKIRARLDPHSNGPLARRILHSPRYINWNGKPMVRLNEDQGRDGKGLYSLKGRVYRYDYRLLRQLLRVSYTGHAMFFKEDNPTPIDFDNKEWQSNLDDTAHMLHELKESDMPERLTRPRRMDWMGILMGLMAGALLVFTFLVAFGRLK